MEFDIDLSPNQYRFACSSARYVWLIGPAGEGKTYAGVAGLLAHKARTGKDAIRCFLCRDTHMNIKRNTVPSIKAGFPGMFRFFDDDHRMVGAGLDVWLFGMDNLDSLNAIQGGEYDAGWLEEPAPVLSVGNCGMRHEVFLRAATQIRGGSSAKRLQITMNPADEEHWTSKEQDYPLDSTDIINIPAGENVHLTDADRESNRQVYRNRPDLYARFVEGKRAKVYAGVSITPNYGDLHQARHRLDPDPKLICYRFWDGGLNPTCCWIQQRTDGGIWSLDCVMLPNNGMRQLIEQRVIPVQNERGYNEIARWRDIGDPSLDNREQSDSEHDAARVINELLKTSFEQGEKYWEPRRDALLTVLELSSKGQPLFQVSPHVTPGEPYNRVHAALSGGYSYSVNNQGIVLKDGPLKNEHSHPGDALSHGFAKMFRTVKEQPKTVTARERDDRLKRAKSYAVS